MSISKKLVPLLAIPLFVACAAELETDEVATASVSDRTARTGGPVYTPAEYFASSQLLNTTSYANQHFSVAYTDVVDAAGQPAVGVKVHGRFTGDINYKATAVTDSDGRLSVWSPTYATHLVVGFSVDKITYSNPVGTEVTAILDADNVEPQGCQHTNPVPTE